MNSFASVALAGILLLAGCAEMTAEGCSTLNWYRQGYADGTRTLYSIVDQHVARCGAFGVKPDAAQYEKGFVDARWDVEHRFK